MAACPGLGCGIFVAVTYAVAIALISLGLSTPNWLTITENVYDPDADQALISKLREGCFPGLKVANYSTSIGLFQACFSRGVRERNPCVAYADECPDCCVWLDSSTKIADYLFRVFTLDKSLLDEELYEMSDYVVGLQVVFLLVAALYLGAGGVLIATFCSSGCVSKVNMYAIYSCTMLSAALLTIGGCSMFGSSINSMFEAIKFTRMLQCGFPCPDDRVGLVFPTMMYGRYLGWSLGLSLLSLLPLGLSVLGALLMARAAAHRQFVDLYGDKGPLLASSLPAGYTDYSDHQYSHSPPMSYRR